MRLLSGSDIIDFYNGRDDLLAITAEGEFTTIDYSDVVSSPYQDGRVTACDYVTLHDDTEVQVLVGRSMIDEGDWFPDALDENGDLDAAVADEMADNINDNLYLHTRLEVTEIHKATAAWEASAEETNRLADQRARRVAALVRRCGSQSQAARLLGLDQSTVNKLVRKIS